MNKKRLHQIISDLIEVVGEKGLKVSNEVILEQACTYERGEIANENKFKTQSSQNSASSGKKEDSKPNDSVTKEAEIILATPRQLNYIYQNGLDVNTQGLTKDVARQIISEDMKRRGK